MSALPSSNARPPRRQAIVAAVETVTPLMRRITLHGADVAAFLGQAGVDAPAAWIKLFVPMAAPAVGEVGRAYTIRSLDRAAATLTVDFVLHVGGHVSAWAAQARPGDVLSFGGPRDGGFSLLPDTRWLVLAGDETALPAIQSILAQLPAGLKSFVVVAVDNPGERQAIHTLADPVVIWLARSDVSLQRAGLHAVMAELMLPANGAGQVWLAGESSMVKGLRSYWLEQRGLERAAVQAKGYWKQGEADFRSRED